MKIKTLSILAVFVTINSTLYGQQENDYEIPRTQWGQPDLQGVWNFSSDIPMQRPERYGDRQFLTQEEIQEMQARIESRREAADAAAAQRVVDPDAPPVTDNPGGYNDFWVESAGIGDVVRTSHIIYPEDGRYPPATEGAPRQFGGLGPDVPGDRPVRYVVGGIGKTGPEDRGLSERCIVGFNSGPPFRPSLYNNNLQIVQNRDTVVVLTEMIHDARIVPITDAPHVHEDIGLWSGDSRGYWEGDTLVVETRNFNNERQPFGSVGTTGDLTLTERFTRVDFDQVNYEFTIDSPASYTDKITAVVPMTKVAGQIYEYACHEGNYGMVNILRGARVEEQMAQEDER